MRGVAAGRARRGGPPRNARRGAERMLATVPARTRDEIVRFFGDLTLVEPGLTDIWAWRPDGDAAVTTSEFMRILAGVARKN
jgi:S-adenosyl methyltransferase